MKQLFVIIAIIIVAGITLFYLSISSKPSSSNPNTTANNLPEITQTTNPHPNSPNTSYQIYTQDAFAAQSTNRRVLFFHANWCPTCKAVNQAFEQNSARIPQDVVIFKTDYDTESALKQKYAITYQHTFVQVDAEGNELAKWNGGGIDELIANLK